MLQLLQRYLNRVKYIVHQMAKTALFLRSSDVALLLTSTAPSCIRASCSFENWYISYARSAPQYCPYYMCLENNNVLQKDCQLLQFSVSVVLLTGRLVATDGPIVKPTYQAVIGWLYLLNNLCTGLRCENRSTGLEQNRLHVELSLLLLWTVCTNLFDQCVHWLVNR